MSYTVYKHTCPNGKVYIGITSMQPEKRWDYGRGYSKNPHFSAAIQKYGWQNIKHEIIKTGLRKDDACEMEISLIAKYNSLDRELGYNLESGGFTPQISPETRIKQSNVKKGCVPWNKGTPHTEETKKKISAALKGKGHICSEITREKLRKTSAGKKHSDETKEKLRALHKGKKASDETRKKMSETRKGRAFTSEHKKALSEAAKKRYSQKEASISA